MVPVDRFVNMTVSGLRPLVGPPANAATGMIAPMPVTALVLLKLLPVLKTMALLKLIAFVGERRSPRFVEPKPGSEKGVPDNMLKGGEDVPSATNTALPLVIAAPPRFVTTKLACALEPSATFPKLRLDGNTPSWPGVS